MTRCNYGAAADLLSKVQWLGRIQAKPYSTKAKAVAAALFQCHNSASGRCDPGAEHLAALASLGRRSVQRAIDELVTGGDLRKIVRPVGSRFRTNAYILVGTARRDRSKAPDVRPELGARGANGAPGGATVARAGGVTVAQELTHIEPSKELAGAPSAIAGDEINADAAPGRRGEADTLDRCGAEGAASPCVEEPGAGSRSASAPSSHQAPSDQSAPPSAASFTVSDCYPRTEGAGNSELVERLSTLARQSKKSNGIALASWLREARVLRFEEGRELVLEAPRLAAAWLTSNAQDVRDVAKWAGLGVERVEIKTQRAAR